MGLTTMPEALHEGLADAVLFRVGEDRSARGEGANAEAVARHSARTRRNRCIVSGHNKEDIDAYTIAAYLHSPLRIPLD